MTLLNVGGPPDIGTQVIGVAVTHTLHVSPDGDNSTGKTWGTAFTTIQAALDTASTDANDCTLILVAPVTTFYDINTTGDPTWAANVIIQGSHRNWAKIQNSHASATSIMKLTGKAALMDLYFNLGSGSSNGVILTQSGFRVDNCQFVGEDLTGAATARDPRLTGCPASPWTALAMHTLLRCTAGTLSRLRRMGSSPRLSARRATAWGTRLTRRAVSP